MSGAIGNHGVAVMAERNGLSFNPPVLSDTAPLNPDGGGDYRIRRCARNERPHEGRTGYDTQKWL